MVVTVNRYDATEDRWLPSLVVSDDGSREWWDVWTAERDERPEPQERRRSVGHPAETMEGPDDE